MGVLSALLRRTKFDFGTRSVDLGGVLGVRGDERPVPNPHDSVSTRFGEILGKLEVGLAVQLLKSVLVVTSGVDRNGEVVSSVLVALTVVVVVGSEKFTLSITTLAIGSPGVENVVDAVRVLVVESAVDVHDAISVRTRSQVRLSDVTVLLVEQGNVVSGGSTEAVDLIVSTGLMLADGRVSGGI